jgi:hypothetical protein
MRVGSTSRKQAIGTERAEKAAALGATNLLTQDIPETLQPFVKNGNCK